MKRDEFIKKIREDGNVKKAIGSVNDAAERRRIKAHTEAFMISFYDNVLGPLHDALQKDPEAVRNALLEIRDSLVMNSGSIEEDTT